MWCMERRRVSFSFTQFVIRNPTDNLADFSASEVLDNHKSVPASYWIQANNEELDLPYIYWI